MLSRDSAGRRNLLGFGTGADRAGLSDSFVIVIETRRLACETCRRNECGQIVSVNATDPFDLQRFVDAQSRVYDTVVGELRGGRKRSHWMWFVFPQLAGLGSSPTAVRFAISSIEEARAYLAHELLGARLRECAGLVAQIDGRTAEQIFGWPDDMKLRSSMTLFARAADDSAVFVAVLEKLYGGQQDPATLARLT
jgi:uncharacterized protein (DUF1810 family)